MFEETRIRSVLQDIVPIEEYIYEIANKLSSIRFKIYDCDYDNYVFENDEIIIFFRSSYHDDDSFTFPVSYLWSSLEEIETLEKLKNG